MCSVRQQFLGCVTQMNICATNCSGELHYETLRWMTGSDSLPKKQPLRNTLPHRQLAHAFTSSIQSQKIRNVVSCNFKP